MKFLRLRLLLIIPFIAGCTNIPQNIQVPTAKEMPVVELKDGDTYTLEAQVIQKEINGKTIEMFGYNGSIPGPRIEVAKGSHATIILKNSLPVSTTLHSHGIRMDNAFDGVEGVTQEAVRPGESFEYKLNFPDEGLFWYHPHIREDYQQEKGLYGNILVRDMYLKNDHVKENFVFLDDILLDENGIVPFSSKTIDHSLMGRFGNTLLINGQSVEEKQEILPTIELLQGDTLRSYFTDSANTRTFDIQLKKDGNPDFLSWYMIASDNEIYPEPFEQKNIIIAPGERYISENYFQEVGQYTITHRGTPLMKIEVSPDTPENIQKKMFVEDMKRASLQPLMDQHLKTSPDKELQLNVNMSTMNHMGGGMMSMNHSSPEGIEWEDTMPMMNEMATSENTTWEITDTQTGKKNMDIDWNFKKDSYVKMRIVNDANSAHPMQHPFHIHGQRFIVLTQDGKTNEHPVWKDTTLLPSGTTTDILVEMSNPGVWMTHCHIAEHLHSGMMFSFKVNE